MNKVTGLVLAFTLPLALFAQEISYAEYFIDADPGFGEAVSIPVSTSGTELDLQFTVNLQSLDPGMHQLFCRAKDDSGKWGPTNFSSFFMVKMATPDESNILEMEYFIDTDPGFGAATSVPVNSTGKELTLDFTAGLQSLDPGIHQVFFRAKDGAGRWSTVVFNTFFMIKLPDTGKSDIQATEYFIDNDPGFGAAISVPVTSPGTELSLDLTADLQGLDPGIHQVFFRAKDGAGRWGSVISSTFFMVNIPPSEKLNIQELEYFIDDDPGYGNAIQLDLPSPGLEIEIDFNISMSGLSDGDHVIYLRAKNAANQWGQLFMEGFILNSDENGQNDFISLYKIYPNPASEQIIIEMADQSLQSVPIHISNMSGAVVYETLCNDHPCKITPGLPAGIYLISIKIDETYITQKIKME